MHTRNNYLFIHFLLLSISITANFSASESVKFQKNNHHKILSIIPPDDRDIITNTNDYPWSTICKLVTYNDDNSITYNTGVLIKHPSRGAYHILTTALDFSHLSDNNVDIEVYPGVNGEYRPYGYAKVEPNGIRFFPEFKRGDASFDLALLTLDRNVGIYSNGMRMWTSVNPINYYNKIEGAGFPHEINNDEGTKLFYHAGCCLEFFEEVLFYSVDSTSGQWGMPLFFQDNNLAYLMGIHVGQAQKNDLNIGSRLTQDKINTIINWMNEDRIPRSQADLIDDGPLFWGIDKTNLNKDDTVKIWLDVRNIGTRMATQYSVTFYAFPIREFKFAPRKGIYNLKENAKPYEFGKVAAAGNLKPYESQTVIYSGTMPIDIENGLYLIGWDIDSDEQVSEIDESNNYYGLDDIKVAIRDRVNSNPIDPEEPKELQPQLKILDLLASDGVDDTNPLEEIPIGFEYYITLKWTSLNTEANNVTIDIMHDNKVIFSRGSHAIKPGAKQTIRLNPPITATAGRHVIQANIHTNQGTISDSQRIYIYSVDPKLKSYTFEAYGSEKLENNSERVEWLINFESEAIIKPKRRLCPEIWECHISKLVGNIEYNFKRTYLDTGGQNHYIESKEFDLSYDEFENIDKSILYSTFHNTFMTMNIHLPFYCNFNYPYNVQTKFCPDHFSYTDIDMNGMDNGILNVNFYPRYSFLPYALFGNSTRFFLDTYMDNKKLEFLKKDPNESPVADFYIDPIVASVYQDILLSAFDSYDPDGEIVSYQWDIGEDNFKTGLFPTIKFNDPGIYPITLIVTDDEGNVDTITKEVRIKGYDFKILDYNPKHRIDSNDLSWITTLDEYDKIASDGITEALLVVNGLPDNIDEISFNISSHSIYSGELFSIDSTSDNDFVSIVTVPVIEIDGVNTAIVGYRAPTNYKDKLYGIESERIIKIDLGVTRSARYHK